MGSESAGPAGRSALAVTISICLSLCALPAGATAPSGFADCATGVDADPGDRSAYRCYLEVARRDGSFAAAAAALERLLDADPDNGSALRWLAQVEADRGDDRARDLFERAAAGFAAAGLLDDEVETRVAYASFLRIRGARDLAVMELGRARQAAERGASRYARARLEVAEANLEIAAGHYASAERRLERVEAGVFAQGPIELRASWLSAMAARLWFLSESERAERTYRRVDQLWSRAGDNYSRASTLTNLTLVASSLGRPREEQRALAQRSLELALASGNRRIAGRAHSYLSFLVLLDSVTESVAHAEQALRLSRSVRDVDGVQMALRALAHAVADHDSARTMAILEEAVTLARRSGDRAQEARNRITRSRLLWKTGPRERAIEGSLEALDAIEATRETQPDAETRARRFAAWRIAYFEFVSHLLEGDLLPEGDEPARQDLDLAFQIVERTRARVLLDELDASSATPVLSRGSALADEWVAAHARISRIQRQLLDHGLEKGERNRLFSELLEAEREEAGLRAELARRKPAFGAVRAPELASVSDVQESLGEDQALISIWARRGRFGGSIAFVVTKAELEVCALPGYEAIDPELSLYLGLVSRGDLLERRAASRLHRTLLDCALAKLPPGVRRLVIVPSEGLGRLPMHALRASTEAATLGARFEVVAVTSATVWLRLRQLPPTSRSGSALVLADPMVAGNRRAGAESSWHSGPLARTTSLGPLPGAREEGRSAHRLAGRGSRLLVGDRASEKAVKEADLSRFSILHFAAHAITDEQRPDRSAIVLAPGGPEEDGLLQLREIVEIDLSGQLVVLSACRSAAGLQVYGEGVLGLARGFLVAGARGLVGSLWPLKDDDAAALLEEFYRALGSGKSVAAALSAAQQARRQAGAPVEAWAGLVVLGDGDLVPIPEGRRSVEWLPWLLALLGLGTGVGVALRRRRNR